MRFGEQRTHSCAAFACHPNVIARNSPKWPEWANCLRINATINHTKMEQILMASASAQRVLWAIHCDGTVIPKQISFLPRSLHLIFAAHSSAATWVARINYKCLFTRLTEHGRRHHSPSSCKEYAVRQVYSLCNKIYNKNNGWLRFWGTEARACAMRPCHHTRTNNFSNSLCFRPNRVLIIFSLFLLELRLAQKRFGSGQNVRLRRPIIVLLLRQRRDTRSETRENAIHFQILCEWKSLSWPGRWKGTRFVCYVSLPLSLSLFCSTRV